MLILLISLLIGGGCGYASFINHWGLGAAIGYGITGFFLSMILFGFVIRKRIAKVQEELQAIMQQGQSRINLKVQKFQSRPGGNPTQMQRELEGEQKVMIKKSLEFLPKLEPFKKWNLLMGRQISTMRLQFLYQLKEFKKVDEILEAKSLFERPMLSEPILAAMKMARQYENKDIKGAEKTFKKRVKWFRGERATLLYGLISWIYMKEGRTDDARKILLTGKEVTGNQTLARNWEHLSNNNDRKFSNAGLGDEWYSLYLEKAVVPKQKRMRGNAKAANRF
ncbi:hypothetical protein P0Y35_11465 [Kiritimatiellaeota bacterium B1221]|nr:hypothetical protein [Kiritimatiellaeota bacterium B1221]